MISTQKNWKQGLEQMFEHSVYNSQKEKLSVHQQINNSKKCHIYIYIYIYIYIHTHTHTHTHTQREWNIIQLLILLLLNIIYSPFKRKQILTHATMWNKLDDN